MNIIQEFIDYLKRPRQARDISLRYEPFNLTRSATVNTIKSALVAAEAGTTRDLFTLYRDISSEGSHVFAEHSKRKLSVLGQPISIQPRDKSSPEDVIAAQAVSRLIADCENWSDGLNHLLNSTLWPVAVCEKVFKAVDPSENLGRQVALRYTLKRFEIINPQVLCFVHTARMGFSTQIQLSEWEPDLRFFATDADGRIDYSWVKSLPAEPIRHVIHRGHLLAGLRDCWGGPMRAIVFWWLLSALGREWFGRYMDRFGSPFLVGRTDAANQEAVNLLKDAFSLSTKIGGLVVDHDTSVELEQAMTNGGADAFERFLSVCNREISKVILGQSLSADAQSTGLGSGQGKLQGEVRDDIRIYDQMRLAETLEKQLFGPFLRINGLAGQAPKAIWGGLSAEDTAATANTLKTLKDAGLEPTDEALPVISERMGFPLQRSAAVAPAGFPPGFGNTTSFSAAIPKATHPSDRVASEKAKALGEAYRGALAPVRQIILSSSSPEEAQARLAAFYADWDPKRVKALTEEALQICAATGAAVATRK